MANSGDEKHFRTLSAVRSIDLTTPIRMKLISLQIGKDVSASGESPDELLALLMEATRRLLKYDQAVAAGQLSPEPDRTG